MHDYEIWKLVVRSDSVDLLRLLVSHVGKIPYQNHFLLIACRKGDNDMIIEILRSSDRFYMQYCYCSSFKECCTKGLIEPVAYMIKNWREDIDISAYRYNCFKLPVSKGYLEIVKILLDNFREELCDADLMTAAMFNAIEKGRNSLLTTLMRYCVDMNLKINWEPIYDKAMKNKSQLESFK